MNSFSTILILLITLTYLIYTLSFAIRLKKFKHLFTPKQMKIHSIMIWLVPFLWIISIKIIVKPLPSRDEFKDKKEWSNGIPYEDRNKNMLRGG